MMAILLCLGISAIVVGLALEYRNRLGDKAFRAGWEGALMAHEHELDYHDFSCTLCKRQEDLNEALNGTGRAERDAN